MQQLDALIFRRIVLLNQALTHAVFSRSLKTIVPATSPFAVSVHDVVKIHIAFPPLFWVVLTPCTAYPPRRCFPWSSALGTGWSANSRGCSGISHFPTVSCSTAVCQWARSQLAKAFLTTSTLYGTPLMRIIPPGMQQISVISSTISLTTLLFCPLVGFKQICRSTSRVNPVPCLHVYTVFHPVISIRFVDLNVMDMDWIYGYWVNTFWIYGYLIVPSFPHPAFLHAVVPFRCFHLRFFPCRIVHHRFFRLFFRLPDGLFVKSCIRYHSCVPSAPRVCTR